MFVPLNWTFGLDQVCVRRVIVVRASQGLTKLRKLSRRESNVGLGSLHKGTDFIGLTVGSWCLTNK